MPATFKATPRITHHADAEEYTVGGHRGHWRIMAACFPSDGRGRRLRPTGLVFSVKADAQAVVDFLTLNLFLQRG